METLGDKIHRLRKQSGLSQEELGFRIGVSRQAISLWEKNELMPKSDKLIALSKQFDVTVDYLLDNGKEINSPVDNLSEKKGYIQIVGSSAKNNKGKKIFLSVILFLALLLIVLLAVGAVGLLTFRARGFYTLQSVSVNFNSGIFILLICIAAIVIISLIISIIKKFIDNSSKK